MTGEIPPTLTALLLQHAEPAPDAVAICGPHAPPSLTYSALATLAASVRAALRRGGILPTDRVAVVLPNGPEMATTFLTVASACVCAPLNPSFREKELEFYLSDLKIKGLILAEADHGPARATADSLGIPCWNLQRSVDDPAGWFDLQLPVGARPVEDEETLPDDVALVLHTSGTTARPKIVPLTQRNLIVSARNIRDTLQLTPVDRCLNVMPLFHIHGLIGAVLSSITAGASVACCPPFDPDRSLGWFESVQPTWYTAVPTIHQAILAQIERSGSKPPCGTLRLIRSSSSSLPPVVMQRLEDAFGVPVLESYGMTEASHQMASNPLPPAARKPGSVGLPAGPDMGIMNDAGEFQPTGVIGEIVIRGDNVTAGYADRPEANATAFVDAWFRTGDQGWRDDDGYYFLTGRLKELINRGGEKIAPREVDDVLLELPEVAQAVTFAVPHPRLGEDVAAAVVLRPGVVATEQTLRELALPRLAAVKMPSRFILVAEIPKGGTGKVQRIGLFEKLQHLFATEFAAPKTDLQRRLASIWMEFLGVPHVGLDDNFFYLGGDSLLATRVVNRINAELFGELRMTLLFEHPKLGEFAEAISKLQQSSPLEEPAQVMPIRSRRMDRNRSASRATANPLAAVPTQIASRSKGDESLSFSLSFFSADGSITSHDKYRLITDCARSADEIGLTAIWLPERHFSRFGGLYPSPAVLGAAVAALTKRLQIRAGSVVLPLQHPLRVVEEWSLVDNLSQGRVAIACASGWHPNDFVLAPQNFADRRTITREQIDLIRRLWRGDAVTLPNGLGTPIPVRILPRPVQTELPIWLTAHFDETFRLAGELGANVYTNIWKSELPQLQRQIELYRKSWNRHQPNGTRGHVTLMIHTFLGESEQEVERTVRTAYGEYLESFLELRDTQAQGENQAFHLPPDDRERLVTLATDQLLASRGLVGTRAQCLAKLQTIRECGVDEVACLVDFGVPTDDVMKSLAILGEVARQSAERPS